MSLEWLPDGAIAAILIAVSVTVVQTGFFIVERLVRALPASRYTYLRTIFMRVRPPLRLALVVFAFVIAVPAAPLDHETAILIARCLGVTTIALIGWGALIALNTAAELYLLRYKIDTEDNLTARKHQTQIRVLLRVVDTLLVIVTIGAALMTFQSVRQYGVSLFASAGVAGLVAGLAARPVLSNIFAGVQLAMTQPIRLQDVVIVENEYGTVEEITSTYVVVRLWDLRRMIVPLTYFIEKPFQNWTRHDSALLGTVMLYLDYRAPIDAIREKVKALVEESNLWNGKAAGVQVTDAKNDVIEVRILISANRASAAFDLRCLIREQVIAFLAQEHPYALPRQRTEVETPEKVQQIPTGETQASAEFLPTPPQARQVKRA